MDQQSSLKRKDNPRQTSSEFHIHEIQDNEIGYDADVEILRPDAYEEPDSEKSEGPASPTENEDHLRNELVQHMKSLSCNPDARVLSQEVDLGRRHKRRSTDAFRASNTRSSTPLSESQLEVTEIADDQDSRPPLKRARRRRRRSRPACGLVHKLLTSESEIEENNNGGGDSRTTPMEESVATESSPQAHLDDSMDLD